VAFDEFRGTPRIVGLSAAAERRGVTAGMALAEAKALAADLVALPWDEKTIGRAALEVTAALLSASPRVSWEGTGAPGRRGTGQGRTGEGVWLVDAAGLGSETTLARKLLTLAQDVGYGAARIGVADSAIAAYAASCARAAPFTIVTPGADAAFLAGFPIALLDIDEDLEETLTALGITTLGRLAALHPDEVEARFGPAGLAAHQLARGRDHRGPSTPRENGLPTIEAELGGPVATAEPLLFVLRGALASLGEALSARGLAARELSLVLHLDDGSVAERAVRPARPSSHAEVLFDHCRVALEDWRLGEPAVALALRASVTVPASGEQGDLLAPRWADPAALEAAFDRIRGREGGDAVAVPAAHDAHLPDDAGAWVRDETEARRARRAQKAQRPGSSTETVARERGEPQTYGAAGAWRHSDSGEPFRPPLSALRLLQAPAPARVRLGRSGLEAFRYEQIWHDVAEWCGPERLAPRWWSDAGAPRDYYSARTTDGALWLIFRDAVKRRWYVGGWWD
jgi:protein ImuB